MCNQCLSIRKSLSTNGTFFFQREKDNEIKEVEIENKYHEKILSQLIRSMNLPMLFIDKEGKIAFTNQSFRKGFEIPHLKGRYYKDIFVGVCDFDYVV